MTSPSALSRARLVAAGVLTGVTGLAVSLVGTEVLRERLDAPNAVAEAVVEATPGKLALSLVHLVGRWDKPLLLGGTYAMLVVLSAVAGLVSGKGVRRGQLVFGAMAAISLGAVLTRPHAEPGSAIPALMGALTWLLLLPYLVSWATAAGSADPAPGSRRAFLLRAGVVAVAAVVLGTGSRLLGRKRRAVEDARAGLDLPVTDGAVPEGADLDLEGLVPWQVPNDDFYRIDTAFVVPTIDVDSWRLRIHGMVEKELTLSFQDLLDRRLTEAWVTLCCVSNEVGGDLIGNAWWSGVRVADLLAEAGPRPGADAVRQTSDDGWDCGTPLPVLTDGRDALLAVAMNGEPLPLEHGFPVRMVVPGLYGFVSATKWLVDLEVTRFEDFSAFWTQRGWAPEAPVRTESRIDVPRANHRVDAGDVRVAGVAWAQHTGIEAVEVRLDGGAWTRVELARVPSVDTWVQWTGTVSADPGVHKLAVRATDRSGYTQTGVRRDVVPDGATGWHTVEFTAE